jgi:hypothetical protein
VAHKRWKLSDYFNFAAAWRFRHFPEINTKQTPLGAKIFGGQTFYLSIVQ